MTIAERLQSELAQREAELAEWKTLAARRLLEINKLMEERVYLLGRCSEMMRMLREPLPLQRPGVRYHGQFTTTGQEREGI